VATVYNIAYSDWAEYSLLQMVTILVTGTGLIIGYSDLIHYREKQRGTLLGRATLYSVGYRLYY
jgi:hypothetical protein